MSAMEGVYQKGDLLCRPTDWTDIVKFFLLNYGLHALTVMAEPGSTWISKAVTSLTAVFMPSVGVAAAFQALYRAANRGKTELEVALRSGALCMLVPADRVFIGGDREEFERTLKTTFNLIVPQFTHVHGDYPETEDRISDTLSEETNNTAQHNDTAQPIQQPQSPQPSEYTGEMGIHPHIDPAAGPLYGPQAGNARVHAYPATGPYEHQAGVPGMQQYTAPTGYFYGSQAGDKDQPQNSITPVSDYGYQQKNGTKDIEGQRTRKLYLIQVPHWFSTHEMNTGSATATGDDKKQGTRQWFNDSVQWLKDSIRSALCLSKGLGIASNYSLIKSVSAILQILYGCFELYRSRGDQLEKYGYATYSLTVIPYVLMSLANLLASISGPQYSSMFIVHYRGKWDGADKQGDTKDDRHDKHRSFASLSTIVGPNAFLAGIHSQSTSPSNETEHQYGPGYKDGVKHEMENGYPDGWWDAAERKEIEGEIVGAVGEVYGDFWPKEGTVKETRSRRRAILALAKSLQSIAALEALLSSLILALTSSSWKSKGLKGFIDTLTATIKRTSKRKSTISFIRLFLISAFSIAVTAAPYVIIGVLTGFKKRDSTRAQRSWIMCWLVIGQVGATVISTIQQSSVMRYFEWKHRHAAYFTMTFVTVCFSVATVGGFVMVAQMMVGDEVCRRF